jgi:ABC-type multidrug transport system ATPase subunit
MLEKAIEVQDLHYSYGKTRAVDGVSFTVLPGEIMGFLGPNGAGKSTTIKMLTGMLRLQGGSAHLLGMDVRTHRKDVQQRIGICFEEKNLYLNMSAVENLRFFARLFGIKGYSPKEALERVGLTDRRNDRVKKYSKGMRQRLMVARALVNNPDILFLDEPTDGLDPVSSRAIRAIVQAEADRGAAIFLTTHDMNEADQLSDRVAFINEGKIVALDTPEELKLKHGKRAVKIRAKQGGEVVEETIQLDTNDAGEQLKQAVTTEGLMTIHTEEATLEDIFVKLTGRGLV